MTNKNRKEYANALSKLGKWNYTTYFRGQWKITHEYAEKLAMRLMKSRIIKKVFLIIEKDLDPKSNHIHFLLEAEELNREKLSRITKFNRTGIGNIEKIIEKKQVTKYLLKNLGEDFSYHNLYL